MEGGLQQVADYKGVLAELRAQRVALDQERGKLAVAISAIEALMPKSSQASGVDDSDQVPPRAFRNLLVPDAIKKYLTMVQEPRLKKEIQEALLAGGVKRSKSFSAHVYNTLRRLSKDGGPFQQQSDGRWRLRTWIGTERTADAESPSPN